MVVMLIIISTTATFIQIWKFKNDPQEINNKREPLQIKGH